MTVADEIVISYDDEVTVTSAMAGTSMYRFSYWREARRFAWGIAHENQLAVTGQDRHGWAACWSRPTPSPERSE